MCHICGMSLKPCVVISVVTVGKCIQISAVIISWGSDICEHGKTVHIILININLVNRVIKKKKDSEKRLGLLCFFLNKM